MTCGVGGPVAAHVFERRENDPGLSDAGVFSGLRAQSDGCRATSQCAGVHPELGSGKGRRAGTVNLMAAGERLSPIAFVK